MRVSSVGISCADLDLAVQLPRINLQFPSFTKFTGVSSLAVNKQRRDSEQHRLAGSLLLLFGSHSLLNRTELTGKTLPLALLRFCLLLISSSVNGRDGSSSTGGMGPLTLAGRFRLVPLVDDLPCLPVRSSWSWWV